MKYSYTLGAYLFTALCLSACASTIKLKDIKPLTNTSEQLISEEERKILNRSSRLHKKLESKGLIVRDDSSNTYLKSVSEKISPYFSHPEISLNFYILKDASINAFALPNGNVYINAGLITNLSSQAQLASVLSHEVSHVIHRHSLRKFVDRKNKIVGSHVADLFLFGTGLVYYATISELASYSQAMEMEADHFGLSNFANTDLNLSEGITVLERLKEADYGKEGSSIWSSHPDIDKRISDYKLQLKNIGWQTTKHQTVDKQYEDFRKPLAERVINIRLRNKQFELASKVIKQELLLSPDDARLYFYLGEANRLKGSEVTAYAREYAWLNNIDFDEKLENALTGKQQEFYQKAEINYEQAKNLNNGLLLINKGLGLLALHKGDNSTAKRLLQEYLKADDIKDRRYIQTIIKNI